MKNLWWITIFTTVIVIIGVLSYLGVVKHTGSETETGLSAVMKLDKTTYRVGEKATLTIINTGERAILTGDPYVLYRWENDRWVKINLGFTFTMIGWMVPPGSNWTQIIPLAILVSDGAFGKLEPLPPGRYRVVKSVFPYQSGSLRRRELTLSAEFEVVG